MRLCSDIDEVDVSPASRTDQTDINAANPIGPAMEVLVNFFTPISLGFKCDACLERRLPEGAEWRKKLQQSQILFL